MKFKEAVKDTNEKLSVVVKKIPRVFGDFLMLSAFILTFPIGYPIAILIRMVKK